jgi:hypothetical protein
VKLRVALIALLAGSCVAPQPDAPQRPPVELAGRTAGTPQRCVSIQQSDALRTSDTNRHMLVYGSGRTLWANQLGPSCGFGRDDVLVTEPIGSYHCRGDIVRSIDRYSRIPGPSCILGDWVPYRR